LCPVSAWRSFERSTLSFTTSLGLYLKRYQERPTHHQDDEALLISMMTV
jgi:hypothetical protein